jgi:hypothetical protein
MANHHNTHTKPNYDGPVDRKAGRDTGLLTRFVPDRLKHSALYRWVLRLTRVLQFISAIVSLGIFSARLRKVYRLVNTIKTRQGVNSAYGAVEGILAAAVLYTLLAMLLTFLLKRGGPRWLRWLFVLFDLLFVGAFIAVAVLTSPNGGDAGPKHCYHERGLRGVFGTPARSDDSSCKLPWGTFILAIISTLLHAITAAFHEVHDRYKEHRAVAETRDRYEQPAAVPETRDRYNQPAAVPENRTY